MSEFFAASDTPLIVLQMSRCGMLVCTSGMYRRMKSSRITTTTMQYVESPHNRFHLLSSTGRHGIPTPQHSHSTTRQSIDYTPTSESRLGNRMVEESSLWHPHIHHRERIHPMVSIHLYLPAADRKHLETKNIWRATLHGATSHGRNVDLGHLRQPSDGSTHLSYSIYYRAQNDERAASLANGGVGGLHLQLSVRIPSPSMFRFIIDMFLVLQLLAPPKSISRTATAYTHFSSLIGPIRSTTASITLRTMSP